MGEYKERISMWKFSNMIPVQFFNAINCGRPVANISLPHFLAY